MVTDLEAQMYAEDATPAELAAYRAASQSVVEPAPNVAEQFRDLFLVSLPDHPRAVPVVGIVGVEPSGRHVLDRAWIFWPGKQAAKVCSGETLACVAAVLQAEQEAEAQPFAVRTADAVPTDDDVMAELERSVRFYGATRTDGARDAVISRLPDPAPTPSLRSAFALRQEAVGAFAG